MVLKPWRRRRRLSGENEESPTRELPLGGPIHTRTVLSWPAATDDDRRSLHKGVMGTNGSYGLPAIAPAGRILGRGEGGAREEPSILANRLPSCPLLGVVGIQDVRLANQWPARLVSLLPLGPPKCREKLPVRFERSQISFRNAPPPNGTRSEHISPSKLDISTMKTLQATLSSLNLIYSKPITHEKHKQDLAT